MVYCIEFLCTYVCNDYNVIKCDNIYYFHTCLYPDDSDIPDGCTSVGLSLSGSN